MSTRQISPQIRARLEAEAARRGLSWGGSGKSLKKFKLPDLMVRNEEKELVPLEPNQVQRDYLDKIAPGWEDEDGEIKLERLREIILKARKQGFSTLILGLLFLDTINTPNTYTVVMAHDTDSTVNLFEIVQTFYNNLPVKDRPDTRYANRREYTWPSLGSRFFVGTAGSDDFGRGATVNNVLASEVASWRDGETVATGLFQAVPRSGNIFMESTAKGIGNFFFEEYERARKSTAIKKLSAYRAHFVAWFESRKYREPVPFGWERTEEEEKLASLYDLDDEQLAWRRFKKSESGMDKNFPQEFPSNPREAFISSGGCYFDKLKLEDLLTQIEDIEAERVAVSDDYPDLKRHREFLEVWEAPEAGEIYVIGADVAEGINEYGDHDYHSASVWRVSDGVQVAHFHTRDIEAHDYGLVLADLGSWYNTALLAVERNNHGLATLNAIRYTKHYPDAAVDNSKGVYMHQTYDEKKAPRERKAGFPTDRQSKFFILDELSEAVESENFHPRSTELLTEMMRFIKKKGGKAGAETGHDDRVMDAAIARRMLNLRPRKAKVLAPRRGYGF